MKFCAAELVLILLLCFGLNVSARIHTTCNKTGNEPEHVQIEPSAESRDLKRIRDNWCKYKLCARPSDEFCEARARQMLQRCDVLCECTHIHDKDSYIWVPVKNDYVEHWEELPRWCDKKRCAKLGTRRCPVRARHRWENCGDPHCVCNVWDGKDFESLCKAFPENEICIGVEWEPEDLESYCKKQPGNEKCIGVQWSQETP